METLGEAWWARSVTQKTSHETQLHLNAINKNIALGHIYRNQLL